MHNFFSSLILLLLSPLLLFSQAQLPSVAALDFHKTRRTALRKELPPNSVAVFFANPVRNRANDVDYVYHQDPNFFTSPDGPSRNLFLCSIRTNKPMRREAIPISFLYRSATPTWKCGTAIA